MLRDTMMRDISEVYNPLYPTASHLKGEGALRLVCYRSFVLQGNTTRLRFAASWWVPWPRGGGPPARDWFLREVYTILPPAIGSRLRCTPCEAGGRGGVKEVV
eukprot:8187980-Pyramimonas_sp.AAC.1